MTKIECANDIEKAMNELKKTFKPIKVIKMKQDFYDSLISDMARTEQRSYSEIDSIIQQFSAVPIEIDNEIEKDYEVVEYD